MAGQFDRQLGMFLRKARGQEPYARFARRLGISPSTLYRLENGEQSATLQRVEQILRRLKRKLKDVFPHEY